MTGRTHQIAAYAAVSTLVLVGLREVPPGATVLAMAAAGMVGGLAPDLDKPGSTIWRHVPAGWAISRILQPIFVGGHRHLSHSLLGLALVGLLSWLLLGYLPLPHTPEIVVAPIWWAFLAGYASHLLMDSLTPDGVPWGFPLARFWGFPPRRLGFLRVRTGSMAERWLVAPGLVVIVVLLFYLRAARFPG